MKLLLIEDDPMLGKALHAGLKRDFAVDWVKTAEDAELALRAFNFDVVIADIGLPAMSGLDLIRRLRERDDKTPVIFLTARDTPRDRIAGLDVGADDYLVKPFDFGELQARLRALNRRANGRAEPVLRHGDICIDPVGRTVTQGGARIEVSAREYAILQLLVENTNRVVSRGRIESEIYDMQRMAESNAVEVHISSLRRKLGRGLIRTIRGMGYIVESAEHRGESIGPADGTGPDQALLT